jgi:hypothetical protein
MTEDIAIFGGLAIFFIFLGMGNSIDNLKRRIDNMKLRIEWLERRK